MKVNILPTLNLMAAKAMVILKQIEDSLLLAQQHCEIKNIQFMRNAELSMYCPPCESHTHNYPSDEFNLTATKGDRWAAFLESWIAPDQPPAA